MLARHYFSHKQLHGKTSKEMQEMLFQEKNINWNNQPDFFKRGTFFQRKKIFKELSEDERIKIPEKYRPEKETMVERTVVEELDMPRFSSVKNRVEVIFNGESPI
jgi:tRNA(His) 5'-end guanylyltransferase